MFVIRVLRGKYGIDEFYAGRGDKTTYYIGHAKRYFSEKSARRSIYYLNKKLGLHCPKLSVETIVE